MSKGTFERPAEARRQQFALLVLVILTGLNLRPFLTAIGPLSGEIGRALSLGMDTLAWLTLLPLWLIGIGVLLTPSLRRRASACQLLGLALLLLGVGSAMRFDAQSGALLIASAALCGLGSALVQGGAAGTDQAGLRPQGAAGDGDLLCLHDGGAGHWGPVSPQGLQSASTGRGHWRSGACRCCWPSSG